MKGKMTRLLAVLLCVTLTVGGVAATVLAVGGSKSGSAAGTKQTEKVNLLKEDNAELVKDETVYVLTGADGTVRKILVSDWIKNRAGAATVTDKSNLSDVENVKGDETYTMNGDNLRVWDAQGNDIYCQGTVEQEVPVTLQVSYRLDGKAISAEELAGKSGKVTIRFDYTNEQYEMVSVNGKQEKIYVPFAMLTGLLLDTDVFSNVEVSNGKLLNDGNHTAVIGLAFPGMQSSLNIDAADFEIPDHVEITADVKNFTMTNTVTLATNALFNEFNTDSLNSADDLKDALSKLTDAMTQLLDGSSQLYDGLNTLLEKSDELVAGINRLADGAAQLKSGTEDLSSGAAALNKGAAALADGLSQLAANNDTLNGGAAQVFQALLTTVSNQISAAGLEVPTLTVENYAQVLNALIDSLDEDKVAEQARAVALEKVTAAVEAKRSDIEAAVTAKVKETVTMSVTEAVRAQVEPQVWQAVLAKLQIPGVTTKAEYDAAVAAGLISAEQQAQMEAAVSAALETQMASDSVQALITQNVEAQMASETVQAQIAQLTEQQVQLLIEQNMNSPEVQAQITAALEAAKSGAASISAAKEQLDSYNQFYLGLQTYTAGVASASSGADSLRDGASALNDGASQVRDGMASLYDGILTLKNGAPELVEGVSQLRDGSMKLSDGLKQFNEEGIDKLVSAVDGDLTGLLDRVKAVAAVSEHYRSFAGLADGMDGQVKFIYRTDAIETEN